MPHQEMPMVDLFARLEELGQTIVHAGSTDDEPHRIYEVKRRALVDQLADLDRQEADRVAESARQLRLHIEGLSELVATNRRQLFPGASCEKRLGKLTLNLRTHYFVKPDSRHFDADMRLVDRANNPAGSSPRGLEEVMTQVVRSPGIGKYERLVISFNDKSHEAITVTLRG